MHPRNDPRGPNGKFAGWRALLIICTLALGGFPAAAQSLTSDASAALQRAQQNAAEAQLSYEEHYPDLPLWSEAIDAGREAVAADPDHPAPRRFLAQAYGTVGWYSRAWEAWQAYLDRGGTVDAQVRRRLSEVAAWLGYRAFASGDHSSARTYLETIVELDPDHLGANERLGRLHLEAGEPEAALPYLERAAQTDESLGPLLARARQGAQFGLDAVEAYDAGREAVAQGRLEDALAQFARAAQGNPGFLDAWRRAGELSLRLERPADAVGYLERVAAAEPDAELQESLQLAREQARVGIEAYNALQRGQNAYVQGNRSVAREQFEEATAEYGNYAAAHAWLGRLAFEEEDYDEAAERYELAVELDPTNSEFQMFLAQSEQLQERALAEAEAEAEAQAEAEAAAQEEAQLQAREELAAERAAQEERAQVEAARQQAIQEEEEQAAAEAEAEEQAEAEAEAEEQAAARAQAEAEEEAARQEAQRQRALEEEQERQAAEAEEQERQAAQARAAAQAAAEAEAQAEADEAAEDVAEAQAAAQEEAEAEAAQAAEEDASPQQQPGESQQAALPQDDPESPSTEATPDTARPDGPLVLVDRTVQHEPSNAASSSAFTFVQAEGLDRDLRPYADGTLHQRLEVLTKPSDARVRYQLCLVPSDISVPPACSDAGQLDFTTTGAYEAQQPLPSISGVAAIDWARGLESFMLVLRDPEGEPIDERPLLAGQGAAEQRDVSDYFPMRVRYRAALVPPGGSAPNW